jgi:hypothetical protein
LGLPVARGTARRSKSQALRGLWPVAGYFSASAGELPGRLAGMLG